MGCSQKATDCSFGYWVASSHEEKMTTDDDQTMCGGKKIKIKKVTWMKDYDMVNRFWCQTSTKAHFLWKQQQKRDFPICSFLDLGSHASTSLTWHTSCLFETLFPSVKFLNVIQPWPERRSKGWPWCGGQLSPAQPYSTSVSVPATHAWCFCGKPRPRSCQNDCI